MQTADLLEIPLVKLTFQLDHPRASPTSGCSCPGSPSSPRAPRGACGCHGGLGRQPGAPSWYLALDEREAVSRGRRPRWLGSFGGFLWGWGRCGRRLPVKRILLAGRLKADDTTEGKSGKGAVGLWKAGWPRGRGRGPPHREASPSSVSEALSHPTHLPFPTAQCGCYPGTRTYAFTVGIVMPPLQLKLKVREAE